MKPENLHVTLAFLGQTPEERLPDVAAAATDASEDVQPFDVVFDRAGRFPERGRRPRVVWLGIGEGHASVVLLATRVADALRRRSLRFDDRPPAPHLTLARVREEATLPEAKTIAAAVDEIPPVALRFRVDTTVVFQSVLSPKGPRYTEVARAPLR